MVIDTEKYSESFHYVKYTTNQEILQVVFLLRKTIFKNLKSPLRIIYCYRHFFANFNL